MSRASIIALLLTLGAAAATALLVGFSQPGWVNCMPGSAAALFTDCNANSLADLQAENDRRVGRRRHPPLFSHW
ncbi:hypothetical protein [Bradyrhizobium sp. SZCCHNS2005]|uniref:hypothetical protein n=1 Tax=Bradyrhizobium sp. SZCCHNS2005 TaxID=3057303 RepID=UPI0028ED80F2|nr:hypothetical protein [Bradyrhizobium sp. SZCCHNS2005]